MVLDYFKQISMIPRGSKNNTAISSYLVEFAKEHGLRYIQDAAENVVIFKDASRGFENSPALIMQGHMDMVCEKLNEAVHDFETEGLKLITKDGYICADGTTLGADDGIALAYMLEFLADDTLVHPPLEMIFTTDEEIGMDGAKALDVSCLKGRYMINIDSEEEGVFTASCAGGMTGTVKMSIKRLPVSGILVKLALKGLNGGHSGTDIDKNRSNALVLLGRLLSYLPKRDFKVLSINGGTKDNVIPNEAAMQLVIYPDRFENFMQILSEKTDLIVNELSASEPGIVFKVSADKNLDSKEYSVIGNDGFAKIFFFMTFVPNGVHVMSAQINGMVESSSNLAIFNTGEEAVTAVVSMRSSKRSYIEYMSMKLAGIASVIDSEYETSGEYPGWDMTAESPFRDLLCEAYEEVSGKKAVVSAIHAGLEGGIFMEKMLGLDIVSVGPDVYDIHTVNERMNIDSVQIMYDCLRKAIEAFANKANMFLEEKIEA